MESWLLQEGMHYLNHGAYGACPRSVFAVYQDFQRQMELQPVEFMTRRLEGLLREAREPLAAVLGTQADRLAFVPNATSGTNLVAWSLQLGPEDEVVVNDHEYGAVRSCWDYLAQRFGFRVRTATLPWPVESPQAVVEAIWREVTPRTRLICVSHITSPSALLFPIEEICRRARAEGILTLVDGAHAPGQIPLSLDALGVDFYTGNLHKWMCAPKGAAFLYATRAELLRPLVVSWGLVVPSTVEPAWVSLIQSQGTRDLAAFLAVPAALEFAAGQVAERAACREIVRQADLGLPAPGYASDLQMAAVVLPDGTDWATLKRVLWDEDRIEIPVYEFLGRAMLRFSIQSYNSAADLVALGEALRRRLW